MFIILLSTNNLTFRVFTRSGWKTIQVIFNNKKQEYQVSHLAPLLKYTELSKTKVKSTCKFQRLFQYLIKPNSSKMTLKDTQVPWVTSTCLDFSAFYSIISLYNESPIGHFTHQSALFTKKSRNSFVMFNNNTI